VLGIAARKLMEPADAVEPVNFAGFIWD